MNIERFQFKRITGDWENKKNYKPNNGEPVFIKEGVKDNYPIIIVGDEKNATLEYLYNNKKNVFISNKGVQEIIDALYTNSNENSTADIDTKGTSGDSSKFSRADHTHKITRGIVEGVMNVNGEIATPRCRKISMGTNDPNESRVEGSLGDIYIRYEE